MAKIEKECQTCGKTFSADTKEINRGNAKFCSLSCSGKATKKLEYNHICSHCSKDFKSFSKNSKYCSDSCKQKNYRAKQKALSLNGMSIKYFYKVFENIPCELCKWDKTTRDLHHIIEVANGGTNELNNLLCVCPNCHRMIHNNLISENDIKNVIENRTISSSLPQPDKELDANSGN